MTPKRHNAVVDVNGELMYVDPTTGEIEPLTPQLFIERSGWRTARSGDHSYTVRTPGDPSRSTCMCSESFTWMVEHIFRVGYRARFAGRTYTYFEPGDGYRYWSQGTHPPCQTTILNRAPLEDVPER